LCEFLKKDGLSLKILESLSFKSSVGRSFKNNIDHFDKSDLMCEVEAATEWYDEKYILSELGLDYRVKSLQSASNKYDRYLEAHRQVRQVFDDLLGIRFLCDSYEDIVIPDGCTTLRIADMSNGKAQDDGYRGVHVYYQKDNFHYPIEIQYNTYFDRQLNNWLHKYVYKKGYPNSMGANLRLLYEQGKIRTEKEFREVMADVLCRGETCE